MPTIFTAPNGADVIVKGTKRYADNSWAGLLQLQFYMSQKLRRPE